MGNFWKQGVAAAAIAGFGGVAMAGAVTVDGVIKATDGYTHLFTVAPSSSGPSSMKIYLYQDMDSKSSTYGHLFMGVVLPDDYVDNTYGTSGKGAGGAGSGSDWGHTFDNELGSDRIDDLQFKISGSTKLQIDVDYVALLSKSSTQYYGSSGLTAKNGTFTDLDGKTVTVVDRADVEVGTGSLSDSGDKFFAKTAMDWNYAQYGAANPTWFGSNSISPSAGAAPNWEFKYIWEMEIFDTSWMTSGGTPISFLDPNYGSSLLGNLGITFAGNGVHASPSMGGGYGGTTVTGGGTPPGTPGGTSVVPLPASVWMGGLTLAGAIGLLRRKRRKAAELS